jgi:drug/metabolite transporter (DMT)-like permease
MSGALLALAAGVGFGVFQSLNRQAVRGMDVYVATFVQVAVSAVVLAAIAALTEDLGVLWAAPPTALLNFGLAGLLHFLVGWTFLNASQKRIGAARTSPLIGMNPLFATVLAAVILRELPSWLEIAGIALMVAGATLVSRESNVAEDGTAPTERGLAGMLRASWLGVSAAFFWAISPIFIRLGLDELPSPLLGVTVGVTASAIAYGLILLWQRQRWTSEPFSARAWGYKLAAAVLVGLSTWMRWVAIDLAPVAVVLALLMVSTPVVIVLSPLISGRQVERITALLVLGTALILGGALLLTFV